MSCLGGLPSSGSSGGNSLYLGNTVDLTENNDISSNTQQETIRDSSFAMIAEKILNFSQPNSQGRKVMLQGLVKAGTLTQSQADSLLSAT